MSRITLAALALACPIALALADQPYQAPSAVLLEKAIFTEETVGDLDAAIDLYKQIIEQAGIDRRHAAQAQYRLAMCYLKKGDKTAAVQHFRAVASAYSDQAELADKARQQLSAIGTFQSQASVILRTTPVAFTNDVDPALDKLTVTFDRPMMDKSWSWTGGGDTFPQNAGDIHYDEARTTCTMPVKLEPGKVYWVGINSPSHRNFKTPDGTPAPRYVILFATRDNDGNPMPLPEEMVVRANKINQSAEAVNIAVPTAEVWLKLVDDGKYVESWDAAVGYFRNAVPKEQWQQQLRAARAPLGQLRSRILRSTVFMTSLPGAPDGEYVVVQFDASFEHKQQAVETVTPMKDDDGQWRVSGYYIK